MKIFKNISLWKIKDRTVSAVKRFPLSFIAIATTTLHLFYLVNFDNFFTDEAHVSLFFSQVILYILSVSAILFAEGNWLSNKLKLLLQSLALIFSWLFLINFSWDIGNFESLVVLMITITWILTSLFVSPFIIKTFKKNYDQTTYYTYFYNIASTFAWTFIIWVLLWVLWAIWILTVSELFDIEYSISNSLYENWAIVSLALIAPLYALIVAPSKDSLSQNHFNENTFFSSIIRNITIPFVSIYMVILYAYFIRVLMHFSEWPKWEISWMVIIFSTLWYIAYIFSYIFEDKSKAISTFRKILPFAIIPQVFMLFYAIYLRINQFDLTINRYLVVIFWLWLIWISIYFIVSKSKKLSVIALSIASLIMIISIWPWSIFSLPLERQTDRLIENMKEAWMYNEEGKLIPLKENIEKDEAEKNIISWIKYITNYHNSENLWEIFSINTVNKSSWEVRNDIKEKYNIDTYYNIKFPNKEENNPKIYLSSERYWLWSINVSDFSYIKEIDRYNKNYMSWSASFNEGIISYDKNWEQKSEDISYILEDLRKKYKKDKLKNLRNSDDYYIYDLESWNRLILYRIEILNPSYKWDNSMYNDSISWYILIK